MSPPRVAVIGGGVAATSFVYTLRDQLAARELHVSIFEMGRSVGGRCATRITREQPGLRVDHGAPFFEARTAAFREICAGMPMLSQIDPQKVGVLGADGTFAAHKQEEVRFSPASSGMSGLTEALLRGGDISGPPLAETIFGTMVNDVTAIEGGGWRLGSKKGEALGDFDWLIVTSTGFAHPRWTSTFGGEPPLVKAATSLEDPALDATLAQLAPLTSNPVTACLLAYEGEQAAAWASLPFVKAEFDTDAVLQRVVVQPVSPQLTAVVLHSTHRFAQGSQAVYGATSTAARVAGAASDKGAEEAVLSTMLDAAEKWLVPRWLESTEMLRNPIWGPHLHRWGAAFPGTPLLPSALAMVPSARVAFAGDFLEGELAGSVEGSALSGISTARALLGQLAACEES